MQPFNTLEPRIKQLRKILKESDEIKEKRLLEKEIGMLLKSCKGFSINMCNGTPALGSAIASLDEITEENVRECIAFIMSQKELVSMDIDSFCRQAKFAVIDKAFKNKDGVHSVDTNYGAKLGELTLLDTEKICREFNPLDRAFSEDSLYAKLTGETKALYRRMSSETSAATGINESRLSREYINTAVKSNRHIGEVITEDYRRVFGLVKPPRYIATLFIISSVLAGVIAVFTNIWILPLVFLPAFAVIKPIADLFMAKSVHRQIPLPQIDLKGEIPDNARTLCVISTLLTSPKDAEQVFKKLEAARLKNTSGNLFFAALCDFKAEKSSAVMEDDDEIIEAVRKKFANSRYTVLIRKREYSDTQRCFQGRERKRGAIESLFKLLRCLDFSEVFDDFRKIIGNESNLVDIRYVCALDYDTVPLMDSISELVGIALNPCHKDVGIIAPRITTTLVSSLKTGFSRAMAENGGCAGASSYDSFSGEFYQDCFGEGIFTGKGLIDVDRFIKSCFDRFETEVVLSHDILEGGFCGVAYAGDVEFSDSFPDTSNAYFKRQHRWLRGDLQNFRFMFDKRFSGLTRFKIFDNVRRAVTPISILLCFFAFSFYGIHNPLLIALLALSAVVMPFLNGFLPSVIRGRKFSNYRRFYSPVMSQTKQLLRQCFMELMLLPKNALVSLDALCRTFWRMAVSKRHLLDWTTAAAFDGTVGKNGGHMLAAGLVSVALSGLALLFGNFFALIMSVLFISAIPVIIYCDKTVGESKTKIPEAMRKDLVRNAKQIWNFYEDYVTEEHNYLPPDNVQYSPVYRVTARTSPTNIGMYLLSVVSAKMFGFIDKSGLEKRVDRTVSTIEKLGKWHGNLCNWYTTDKLDVISPFVSSVDSGNYVCCLVALKELLCKENCNSELIARVEEQIESTNLRPFYNEARNLFSIGYDLDEKKLSHHHYDLLMSEARMLSYYAIASGQANKRHWRCLGRVMGKKGKYAAPVAWTGTMFEYFMPELLLSSKEGSMEYEALKFCLHCQEHHGKSRELPFGISESGFYAFDRSLNYQYKAHGVQDIGLKAGLNREYVVSPYSSFIALSYDPISCYNNLAKLEKLGLCHERYGFYEAADFTKHRVGSGYAVVKSHMAHHMGMSMCAVANLLLGMPDDYLAKGEHGGTGSVLQKLFLTNEKMKRAEELMEEKIIAGEPVLGTPQRQEEKEMRTNADVLTTFSVTEPRLNLLSNGRVSVVTSDIGISQTFFDCSGGSGCLNLKAALIPTCDLYNPRGSLYAFIENEKVYPFFNHPSLKASEDAEQYVVFTQNTTEYLSHTKTLKMNSDVFLDEQKPIEIRSFSAVNKSSVKRNLTLAAYIEPALARPRDITAHPAFMDLFLKLTYDETEKLFIASRKERDSDDETVMAIGFADCEDFTFSFNREEVIERNGGIFSALKKARERSTSTVDVPAPCIFIKTDFMLEAHGRAGDKKTAFLFTCYGSSVGEVTALAKNVRAAGSVGANHKFEPSENIISPLVINTIYGRITRRVLGNILYAPQVNGSAVAANNLDVRRLWRFGISGDIPIVLYEPDEPNERLNGADSVIEMKKALSLCQIEFDLVMLYDNPKQEQLYHELRGEINTEVFFIDKNAVPPEELNLLRAAAILSLYSRDILQPVKNTRKSPKPVLALNKCKKLAEREVHGNLDTSGSFTVEETPDVPWCNVVANSRFGTLLSDSSLGFTWALNSRECELTPWVNDLRSDNKGELLVMKCSNSDNTKTKLYDLIDGSKATFSPNTADYSGIAGGIEVNTAVRVYERGMGKRVVVELTNQTKTAKTVEVAYYVEPVIGVNRNSVSSRLIKAEVVENTLVMRNPSNNSLSGAMTLSSDKKAKFLTDKSDFRAGEWGYAANSTGEHSSPLQHSTIGAVIGSVIVKIDLPPHRKEKIKFILSFTKNMDDPLSMEKALKKLRGTVSLPVKEIKSGNTALDELFKHWLPWQVIGCRMWARTGFYQNSGAYGFRDQLQDCLAAVLIRPEVAKRQILRCCCAQFEEGDVLHWWHDLGEGIRKGVRTRYSDDLLWLPYVVADYVTQTGDRGFLKIKTRYSAAPILAEHEHERYSEVGYSMVADSVYQHAKNALEKGYNKSERGLLLMGGGDWCDGYNRVGVGGKGESVWLCMFYGLVARKFSKIALFAGDSDYAAELEIRASELCKAVDEYAWDGEHYLRAFYDDGSKMGGNESDRCRIDLLPQAFAVLADMPNSERVKKAMTSALRELYDSEYKIIKLFTPPFDRAAKDSTVNCQPSERTSSLMSTCQDPGYVMSYPPGVRENGGQYTHAAAWLALACHKLGLDTYATELVNALSPANRGKEFKTEPYYLTADIYTNPKAYGRGGWSIYTGSAGWYYRVLREMYSD